MTCHKQQAICCKETAPADLIGGSIMSPALNNFREAASRDTKRLELTKRCQKTQCWEKSNSVCNYMSRCSPDYPAAP